MLLLEKASFESFLRDFMDPTMDNTKHILNYLMPIIDRVNPEVHDFMQRYANVPLEPLGTPLPVSQGCFYQHIPITTVVSCVHSCPTADGDTPKPCGTHF